jgi:hypothetical protein
MDFAERKAIREPATPFVMWHYRECENPKEASEKRRDKINKWSGKRHAVTNMVEGTNQRIIDLPRGKRGNILRVLIEQAPHHNDGGDRSLLTKIQHTTPASRFMERSLQYEAQLRSLAASLRNDLLY